MKRVDLQRIIRTGFINFKRSGLVSAASVLVVTITLSVITSLIFLQGILHTSLTLMKEKVDVAVYFLPGTEIEKISNVQKSLETMPEVSSVSLTTSEEALEDFRERHKNDYLTLQALDEISKNPLGASLSIKAKDPSQYESVVKFLEGNSEVIQAVKADLDRINYYQNKIVIDKLTQIIKGANRLGILVSFILILISIIITFNTIRLTIYYAREEIGIMRLVGAGNAYIRGPFIVEGIIYGLIATLVTLVLFIPITLWLGQNLSEFLGINAWNFYINNLLKIIGIVLGSGLILGSLSSTIAIRRYLKK